MLIIGALDVQSTETGSVYRRRYSDAQPAWHIKSAWQLKMPGSLMKPAAPLPNRKRSAASRRVKPGGSLPVEQRSARISIQPRLVRRPSTNQWRLTELKNGKDKSNADGISSDSLSRSSCAVKRLARWSSSPHPRQRSTQDQMDLIKAVAERVAISAENARLIR